jgi:hypothetical protein
VTPLWLGPARLETSQSGVAAAALQRRRLSPPSKIGFCAGTFNSTTPKENAHPFSGMGVLFELLDLNPT